MLAKFSKCLLIVALLCATGMHWTVLQSVAWVSMFADNACTVSLPDAIERTLDGNHPCALCKQIAKGRQTEKKSDLQLEVKKLEFIQQAIVLFIHSPEDFMLSGERIARAESLTLTPPVPPPRTA